MQSPWVGSAAAYVAVLIIAAVAMSILFPPFSAVFISGVGFAGAAAIAGTGVTISLLALYLSGSNFRSAKHIFDEIQKQKPKPIDDGFNYQDFSDVDAYISKIRNVKVSFDLSIAYKEDFYFKANKEFQAQRWGIFNSVRIENELTLLQQAIDLQ